jgi:hypothetical protein
MIKWNELRTQIYSGDLREIINSPRTINTVMFNGVDVDEIYD